MYEAKPVSSKCCNYVDDVVVFSESWVQHLNDLKSVIECLGDAGFKIKMKKCTFGRKYLTYLGHRIGGGGVSIPECRVQALSAFVKPRTKRDMRAFLGSMSYYRRFIKGFGSLSSHLTPAVSLRAPRQVEWTRRMESAYGELKQSLCDHVMLCIPSSSDDLRLYTDASGDGIGACLHVVRDGEEFPVAFFSRQLRPAEKNYSITEFESLAIVAAIRHFEQLVYARPLEVVTDHRACLALLDGKGLNRRLLRFALTLQDRAVHIVHRPGLLHQNADGFSRQSWSRDDGSDLSLSACPTGPSLVGGDVGLRLERNGKKDEKEEKNKKEEKDKRE